MVWFVGCVWILVVWLVVFDFSLLLCVSCICDTLGFVFLLCLRFVLRVLLLVLDVMLYVDCCLDCCCKTACCVLRFDCGLR